MTDPPVDIALARPAPIPLHVRGDVFAHPRRKADTKRGDEVALPEHPPARLRREGHKAFIGLVRRVDREVGTLAIELRVPHGREELETHGIAPLDGAPEVRLLDIEGVVPKELHHKELCLARRERSILALPLPARGDGLALRGVEVAVGVCSDGDDVAEAEHAFGVGLVADDAKRPGEGLPRLARLKVPDGKLLPRGRPRKRLLVVLLCKEIVSPVALEVPVPCGGAPPPSRGPGFGWGGGWGLGVGGSGFECLG
jgi:hypothetical protein